ncbi:TrbI/VirB10 family protein [bacterium]|nr:MAG: TrbI/VirB10 family protein [bacterium]
MSVSTQPGGPLQPKLSWRGRLARTAVTGVVALVVLALFFHVDLLGWSGIHLWHAVHPTPTVSPIASPSANSDGLLGAAIAEITGQPVHPTRTPTPQVAAPAAAAPGVSGAAGRAGLLTPEQQRELAESNRVISQVNGSPVDANPFSNLGKDIAYRETAPTAQPAPPPAPAPTSPPVPALVTPSPLTSMGPLLSNPSAPSMVGTVPGQQSGALPVSIAQLDRADEASFVQTTQTVSPYTSAEVSPARSPNEIWPSDGIDCTLKNAIYSDLPGIAIGLIAKDVKSHLPPHNILIPATSEVWGPYNALVGQGQDAMQIRWDVLAYPNGATLPLQSVQATDARGRAGIPADVNNHVGRVYTSTLIGTILSVAGGIAAARAETVGTPSVGQLFGVSANNAVQQQASQRMSAAQSIPPTLMVHGGTPCHLQFAAIQMLPTYSEVVRSYGASR